VVAVAVSVSVSVSVGRSGVLGTQRGRAAGAGVPQLEDPARLAQDDHGLPAQHEQGTNHVLCYAVVVFNVYFIFFVPGLFLLSPFSLLTFCGVVLLCFPRSGCEERGAKSRESSKYFIRVLKTLRGSFLKPSKKYAQRCLPRL
jgi:hypothetical protein